MAIGCTGGKSTSRGEEELCRAKRSVAIRRHHTRPRYHVNDQVLKKGISIFAYAAQEVKDRSHVFLSVFSLADYTRSHYK